jgi:hypothetical protein
LVKSWIFHLGHSAGADQSAIASEASIGPEIITPDCGFITPTGDLDRLVELLRWFDRYRDELPVMGRQARAQAARYTRRNYRSLVIRAVSKLVMNKNFMASHSIAAMTRSSDMLITAAALPYI